ncbi:MAG TPA: peptidylprolyl isomerase [Draconibacterium sp.]|nr:peptidylprolyl isomerase [Draconibacterium sp.]
MNRFAIFVLAAFLTSVVSCGGIGKKPGENIVSIKTDFGEIKVKLYDDTPKHQENFIKLVNEGFYNDLLFHRVINKFMIQGGDPNSRNAEPGAQLGSGSPGYTIPAEIYPKYFHKKGALAAARLGGPRNHGKESSGSQFYIVHGAVYRTGQLDTMEININKQRKDLMMKEHFQAVNSRLTEFREKNDKEGFDKLVAEITIEVDSIYESGRKFTLSKEQRDAYSTIGGYPSLDGEYTVFGEVVEGLDVIDKIAAVKTNSANRPLEDVKMKVELLK